MVQSEPDTLFVFGDNIEQRGFGGQARAMRGEPNGVGIPTKRKPLHLESAYFTDSDFDEVKPLIDAAFEKLRAHSGPIVWPVDGIGTGLAELPQRAPRIYQYIKEQQAALEAPTP